MARANLVWRVDERSATPWTRGYLAAMRLMRDDDAFTGEQHTREVALRLQRRGDHPPTATTRALTRVTTTRVAGMRVWTARPRRGRPLVRVLYLHGGGYVHPLTRDYWRLVRALTRTPAEVVVPAYPLAPGSTADEVLPALTELLHAVAGQQPRLPTVVMGDSAGGALAVVLATRDRDARDGGESGSGELAGVVALSPWLDAALDQPEVAGLEPADPMLAESGLRAAGRWWAGTRSPADPLISPLHADLGGLPPLDVFIGDRDILRPAVDGFVERAREAGARLTVHEVTAMFHVWMTRAVPEGRRTRGDLVRLLRERAG